jgi:hypothetical protein
MTQPWAVERDVAEQGAKHDRVATFAASLRAAVIAQRASVEERGGLMLDDLLLELAQNLPGLIERQAYMLQTLAVLVEDRELVDDGVFALASDDLQLEFHRTSLCVGPQPQPRTMGRPTRRVPGAQRVTTRRQSQSACELAYDTRGRTPAEAAQTGSPRFFMLSKLATMLPRSIPRPDRKLLEPV